MQFYNLLAILSVVLAVPVESQFFTTAFTKAGNVVGGTADKATNGVIKVAEYGGAAIKNAGSSIKNTVVRAGPVLGDAAKATGEVAKLGAIHLATGAVMGVGLAGGFVAVDEIQHRRRRNRVDAHLLQ
jgi:hypothetical protein